MGLIVFSVLFARADDSSNSIALFIGIAFGAVLVWVSQKTNRLINLLVLNVLGIITALNAVLDIWVLVQYADLGNGVVRNDAAAFADQVPLLPTEVVAIIWSGIAVILLGLAFWHGVFKQFRGEVDDSYQNLMGE